MSNSIGCKNASVDNNNIDRVLHAKNLKGQAIQQLCESFNVSVGCSVLLVAYKDERLLELWAQRDLEFVLLKSYNICASSGMLGRKYKEGDRQVPEGLYHINRFNPQSNFFLSLGINYPNDADRAVADIHSPGGDIFIHGGCQSVGCLAMTDEAMMEIYLLCLAAANNGQEKIPVYIFPYRMDRSDLLDLASKKNNQVAWENLQRAHECWKRTNRPLRFEYTSSGLYQMISDSP
jgi:murein L,D-transpeptidase YafK